MDVSVIIPAAGSGSRMNLDVAKQFYLLGGVPVVLHLLRKIDIINEITDIIVALKEGEVDYFKKQIIKNAGLKKRVRTVIGGSTRQESVMAAIKEVRAGSGLIMVHDAVRPLVTPDLIRNAIARTKELKATVAAVEVKDTIKEARDGVVTKTLDRAKLYSAQTPQTFERGILLRAYESALEKGITGTDDAALVERNGQEVFVIPGSYDNIKITTNDDLAIAESILKKQGFV